MTNEEIRAIALEVAKEHAVWIREDWIADFAARFLAAINAKEEPVARLHIRLEDDGLEARVEVLNGENLQVSDSPVNVFLHPAIEPKQAPLPDCVVVQRKITEEAKCVLATPGNYRTYQDQWAALIAAGEVKP